MNTKPHPLEARRLAMDIQFNQLQTWAEEFFKEECLSVARRRNIDYAKPGDPLANIRAKGLKGLVSELKDKNARMENHTQFDIPNMPPELRQETVEKLKNDCIDTINYGWLMWKLLMEQLEEEEP